MSLSSEVIKANFSFPLATSELGIKLTQILNSLKVTDSHDVVNFHASDKWHAKSLPEIVVFPENTEDVSRVLKFAYENRIPVTTRGAGHGYVGGCVPIKGGIALSMIRMNKIVEINTKDGVAIVEPGVITGDLQKAVDDCDWYYPPDPSSLKECSIGGNIATNAGGPRCLKYGVTKNYVLGLEVVLANGKIMNCGGRVHKNVTGFDFVSLFTSSEGMLGIITKATLRLIPKPRSRGMLAAVFPQFENAASAVQAIFQNGHLPSALEITDSFTLNAARKRLGENSLPPGNAHLMLEIDGSSVAVDHELEELKTILKNENASFIQEARDEEECSHFWNTRREFSYSLRDTGLTKLNEDIVVPRSKLIELVKFVRDLEKETGLSIACFGHAGDGNIHTNIMVKNYEKPETFIKANNTLDRLFSWILENGGAISGEHGIGLAKKPWIHQALEQVSIDSHKSVKRALDPRGILNPGKWLD
jgi:glycolate oxidase